MNEDFVSFDLAKKLKEKSFYQPCLAHYNNGKLILQDLYENCGNSAYFFVDAPTIFQVLKWLRKEHKVYIEPCILADADTDADGKVINEYTYWSFTVTNIETGDMIYSEYERIDDKRFDSYEQAALAGIEYVIDNFI